MSQFDTLKAAAALLRQVSGDPLRECEVCEVALTNVGIDADAELRGDCPEHGRVVAWRSGIAVLADGALAILAPNV